MLCGSQRCCCFFFVFFHSTNSSLSKPDAYKDPLLRMQLGQRQHGQRFKCVMLAVANVASSLKHEERGYKGLISSLLSNSTPPDFYIFITSACNIQPQPAPTEVTSVEDIYLILCSCKDFIFCDIQQFSSNTCKQALMCKQA